MKKKVVYTCITGDYDKLIKHTYINPEYDYVCFTDNNILLKSKIKPWKILPLKYTNSDKIRNAKWHKTHPHVLFPEYSESVWVDGNINILTNSLFKRFAKSKQNILIPVHFKRNCIYAECMAVVECQKDSQRNVDKVLKFLEKNNMPKNYGLLETNIIFRRHNNKLIKEINENWWNMIKRYSYRDQLSL
ncbi:MAG: glycosyltransferase domain-containing protein, partial [Alphaproteobacteria bacterium]